MVVQAVVKATSQSNGKGQILTPGVPKPLNGFRCNLECRGYDHTCKSMWRCDNVGGLGEHVKKHMLWFLRYTFFCFFTLFFGSRRARTRGPILTIYMSYDVFPPKDVPLGGLVHTAQHFGGKIPQKPQFWGRE